MNGSDWSWSWLWGMWHVALHSEERIPEQDAPWELKRMHPEVIRTWKSPRVSLFYVCREANESGFDMVDGLVEQFLDLDVPRRQIVIEDFNVDRRDGPKGRR